VRNDGASHSLDPRARAELYCFLAAAYLRPLSPEALGYLTSKGVLQEFYSIYGERVKPALKCLLAAMCAMEDADRIRQEYMDLFAAPTGAYVMPFEDVYCGAAAGGGRGPLLGERAIAVRRLYREAGGEMGRGCNELPTHIGVELAFMSFLCAREADAVSGEERAGCNARAGFYRGLQLRFLREHLSEWFPQLSRAIQTQASSSFYRGLAQLTEVVLERDAARLMSEPAPTVVAPPLH
jgi:TorA maturation chaperone TorD